jgi:hypothetical protein
MSEQTQEPWSRLGDYVFAGPGRGRKILDISCLTGNRAEQIAMRTRIIDDHNACLGIENPATIVPELVAALEKCSDTIRELVRTEQPSWAKGVSLSKWCSVRTACKLSDNVLAKTGKT